MAAQVLFRGQQLGKYEVLDSVVPHRVQESHCANDVIVVIPLWKADRFIDRCKGGKVNDGVDFVFFKDLIEDFSFC